MTNDLANALARIDDALGRIERALARLPSLRAASPVTGNDDRYDRLRTRTQAALAELDTVIARVASEGQH